MKPTKVICVVPDGTGIKNYLFSQIVPNLVNKNVDLLVYHSLTNEALEEVERIHNCKLETRVISTYGETAYQKFLRESICYARLLFNKSLEDNPTILKSWRRKKLGGIKRYFYKLVELYGFLNHKSYNQILKLERKYQKTLLKSIHAEVEFLKSHKPDVVFCTHQRALNAIPIFKAAEVLGIKTVGAIYSWDNLVKARLAIRTSNYCVWSEYMKHEMLRYYPEIEESSIHITGTPQFELYNKAEIISKVSFFAKYGLDVNKYTVCFSGDDILTSPHDPNYLEDLADAIKDSDLNGKVQIVMRRCPADVSGRYDAIVERHSELIIPIEPKWSNTDENWTQLFPYYDDVNLLANICKHCNLVVNVGSTMAHDFAIFDNPAAYINYDVVSDPNWSVKTIYNYQHFRSMPHKDVVYWINSKADYIEIINRTFENTDTLGGDWLKTINSPNIKSEQALTQLIIS